MAKMSGTERLKYYREALEEQRRLLRTAIGGMATGDLVQALCVATSIRTLWGPRITLCRRRAG